MSARIGFVGAMLRSARVVLALALVVVALLVAWREAAAADFYACDCGAGADAQCSVGNDAAGGTSPSAPWRSYERARLAFAALAPGDAINFCRGGVFPASGPSRWVNAACRADAPCTLAAFDPPWGSGDEGRPRIQRSSGPAFGFDDGGDAEPERGYVVRDLELACSACADNEGGVFLFNDVDDVRLERLLIRGFGIGLYVAGANPCSPGAVGCDRMSSRVALLDSEVRDNHFHGVLGGGDDLTIADSVFENNGTSTFLEHNIYLVGTFARARVLRNRLHRSAFAGNGRCEGTSLVVHGTLTDLLVEGNVIHEDVGLATGTCWGIQIAPGNASAERYLRAIVRGNTVIDMGTAAIAVASCVDCVIENNVVVHTQPHAVIAIRAVNASAGSGDALNDGLTVRNNAIHVGTPNSVGIEVGGEGDGHFIVANAIESTATSGYWRCLGLDLPAADYDAVDHNVCSYVPGPQREWEAGSGALAAWQAASGLDAGSVAAPPGFAAPSAPDVDLSAIGPQAAMVGRGDPAFGAPRDILGRLRGPRPDAGAFQFDDGDRLHADGFE